MLQRLSSNPRGANAMMLGGSAPLYLSDYDYMTDYMMLGDEFSDVNAQIGKQLMFAAGQVRDWVIEHKEELIQAGIEIAPWLIQGPLGGMTAKAATHFYRASLKALRLQRAGSFAQNLAAKFTRPQLPQLSNQQLPQLLGPKPLEIKPDTLALQKRINKVLGPERWQNVDYTKLKELLGDVQSLNKAAEKAKQYPELKNWQYSKKDTIGVRIFGQDETNGVRIMKGNVTSDHLSQHQDYVIINKGNIIIDKNGYQIKQDKTGAIYKQKPGSNQRFDFCQDSTIKEPRKHPDAHIPVDEWVKWKNWFKPE
jgi:hypothetical protein